MSVCNKWVHWQAYRVSEDTIYIPKPPMKHHPDVPTKWALSNHGALISLMNGREFMGNWIHKTTDSILGCPWYLVTGL